MSKSAVITVVIVIALLLLGGWSFISSQKPPVPQTPSVSQTPVPQPTSQATDEAEISSEEVDEALLVEITSKGFDPKEIKIKAGQTVTWMNTDTAVHTVNSAIHPTHQVYPRLNLDNIQPGAKKSLSFPDTGTYKYHDHLNPSLTGSITVE